MLEVAWLLVKTSLQLGTCMCAQCGCFMIYRCASFDLNQLTSGLAKGTRRDGGGGGGGGGEGGREGV